MYSKIINPITLRKVKVNTKLGKFILKKYIKQFYGGSSSISKLTEDTLSTSESASVNVLPDELKSTSGKLPINEYELVQKTCFLKDAYDPRQLIDYLNEGLENYLKDMSSKTYTLNVIGSPSENAIVFKLKLPSSS